MTQKKNPVPPPEAKTLPAQLPAELTRKLRAIAAHTGKSQAELLAPLVRRWIDREYAAVAREMNEQVSGCKSAE